MKARLFTLAAATAAAAFASPAAAQMLGQGHAPASSGIGFGPSSDNGLTACRGRTRAFHCGVRAYSNRSVRQSLAWFQYGARRGSAPAMRSIGFILLRGEGGVRADPAAAMGWFYEAALRNDATAMLALSRGFDEGVGVERDPALARYWLQRSAEAGNDQARRLLRAQ